MKTTIELPDDLFREAKATAARRGVSLKSLFREALEEKLAGSTDVVALKETASGWPVPPPDVAIEELRRIHALIEEESEGDDGWLVPPMPMSPEAKRLFDEAIAEFDVIDPDEAMP